jgi:hypothetical protein
MGELQMPWLVWYMGIGGGGYGTSTYKYSTMAYGFARFHPILGEALLSSCINLLLGDSFKESTETV